MLNLHFTEGFVLGAGLLVALGPKDTFVIKNNLTGSNTFALVLICAFSDVLLIALGVVGLGAFITANRWIMVATMSVSIVYLSYFGIRALYAAYRGETFLDEQGAPQRPMPRNQVIKGAILHSLLTPFAWLDTVLVIGSISAIKVGMDKLFFASGAVVASFLWFIALTTGSRFAAPMFRNRRVWQALDIIVCVSVFFLAGKLVADYPWNGS
ncbi:LysE family transporter [Variovorax sp. J22P271]|uniref:LysE/ArgO family amino acid transporter n=1 Tax=Variovorax davisae TaxID=3053515 RepID=UPI0025775BC6|nr:LysE family transporter [Variovorax sp. J22P271]MDM0034749.1 LysE family transporter [Variovorax sp. J22P271]